MYELTCPSCQDIQRSSFVRANAVTRCPACGHVWRISASHFVRHAAQPPAPAAAPPEPELKQEDSPTADPMGGSSVTGLSGLSDIMQAEPAQVSPKITGSAAPPVRQAQLAASAPSRPDPAATRQPRRTAILIVSALAAVVALAGIALAVMFGGDKGEGAATPAAETGVTESETPAAPDLLPQGPPRPDTLGQD